jgi:hypothetical protein
MFSFSRLIPKKQGADPNSLYSTGYLLYIRIDESRCNFQENGMIMRLVSFQNKNVITCWFFVLFFITPYC